MLRDITIGQHFPGTSPLHHMDPRAKIVLSIAYIVVLFMGSNALGLGLSVAFLLFLYGVARIPLKLVAKSLKPIIPIIIFTAILNVCFMPGVGQPLVHWGFLKIYREGVTYAVMIVVRIVCLIAGTSLLTYTTSPIVLTDAIERLLRPLAKLHLPVHELATAMECRCYHGGEGRTRLKTLRLTAKDWLLSAVCVAVLCCIACSGALWARFWG